MLYEKHNEFITWCSMLFIIVVSGSQTKKNFPYIFAYREITISHDNSSSRIVLRITSLGAPRTLGWNPVCHELVIGNHENVFGNSGKTNFGARVRDFLIGIR